ncbi:MAG: sugar ABC transporter permease, partial [Chloroflexota bacterium]
MTVTTDSAKQVPITLTSDLFKLFRRNIQTYAIILALVAIWVFFAFLTDWNYLSAQNFSNLFRQMTVTAFLAVGMVLVIVTGNIDLSVGKLAGFVSVVVAYFQASIWTRVMPDQSIVAASLSVFIGLSVGALFGVAQGYIISYLNVPSFIVTLGGMFILNGAILLVTQGKTIPANQPAIAVIAQGYLPAVGGWIFAALVVAYLYFNMFLSRQKKKEHGFELPNFSLDLLVTTFFSILVVGYVYIVNKYNGVQIPVL